MRYGEESRSVDNERRIDMSELTTRPSTNGEAPLPRRVPRGLLPSTWTGRTLKVEYAPADGMPSSTTGCLLECFAFGPILKSGDGDKFALSWDRISLVQLEED
jgi:hypothetical protein